MATIDGFDVEKKMQQADVQVKSAIATTGVLNAEKRILQVDVRRLPPCLLL
ncbi:hypothetical protein F5887DRAFT_1080581 [Amanita rubescens]|nr:hypothetical protein F5887DRAFT_1080581 [Amanita rubescens]